MSTSPLSDMATEDVLQANGITDVQSLAVGPGVRVGRYRVLSELGRGGMGVVFLAEQHEPVQRTVALKLMQAELASAQAALLFGIESQALAQMEHPAIAKIYDAGRTSDGHPWFAMERIDGPTLGGWLKQTPSSKQVRLQLFVAICQGVGHAHQKGVIHRDLKLGNIMIAQVDGQPQPKIIDFGLALGVLGDRRGASLRAGTRDYMSPEQRAGNAWIDVRSDVYALGVILLKLLAPEKFFELREQSTRPTSLPELLERSLQGDRTAELSASLNCLAQVDEELRWVLRRALATGREQRYGTAYELAEEIQDFLARRPLRAVPDSRAYRTRKFVQRHRPVLLASALALLCLVAGAVAATVGFVRANAQRERAEAALELARVEASKAQRISGFLGDLLGGISPDVARGLDTRLLRLIVDDAQRRAAGELADEPAVLAEVQISMAGAYHAIVDHKRAIELAESALRLLDQPGQDTALSLRLRLAARLATYRIESGDEQTGLSDLAAAVSQLEAAGSGSARDHFWAASALAWYRTYQSGNTASSAEQLQKLLPAMQAQLGVDARDTLFAMLRLAILLGEQERFVEAGAMFDELLQRRIRVYGAEHPDTLTTLNSRAILFLQQRDYAAGAAALKPLLETIERVFGDNHDMCLTIAGNLAGALRQSGQLEQSGPFYRRAYQGMLDKYGPQDRRTLMFRVNLGNFHWQSGEYAVAEELQRGAVDGMLRRFGEEHLITAEAMLGLGRTLSAMKNGSEARQWLQRALAARRKLLPADSADISEVQAELEKLPP